MRAKINIVGINEENAAKILLAKIKKARAEAQKLREMCASALVSEAQEKKLLISALDEREAKTLAQGISRA